MDGPGDGLGGQSSWGRRREAGIGDFISDGLSGGGRESLEGVVRLTEDELPMEPGATRAGRRRQASEPRAHRASQPSSRSCAR